MSQKVLVVDDERDLTEILTFALRRGGFTVLAAHDSATALKLIRGQHPDLIVLDVHMGPDDGFDLLRDVRARGVRTPVIMLTGRQSEDDKVLGLELGADDYVTKPFSHRELLARIMANLRRVIEATPVKEFASICLGRLVLNEAEHLITKDDQPLDLTVTEFRILRHFMLNANAVVGTRDLLRQVWGFEDPNGSNLVRTTVHRLRQKLEDDPANPGLLQTVAGVGFILKTSAQPKSGVRNGRKAAAAR